MGRRRGAGPPPFPSLCRTHPSFPLWTPMSFQPGQQWASRPAHPRAWLAPSVSPGRRRAGLGPRARDPLASAQSLQRPPLRPRPAPPRKSMPPLLPPGPTPRFPPRPRVLTDIRQTDESEERLALGPTLGTGVCVISLRRRRKFGFCDGGARPGAEVAGGGRE